MTYLKLSPEEHNGIPSGYVSERIGRVLETHPSKGRGGELQRERCERNEQLLYKWSGADFVVTHAEVGKGTDVGERMYLDSPTDQAFFADEWCSHCAVELDVALVGPHARVVSVDATVTVTAESLHGIAQVVLVWVLRFTRTHPVLPGVGASR